MLSNKILCLNNNNNNKTSYFPLICYVNLINLKHLILSTFHQFEIRKFITSVYIP